MGEIHDKFCLIYNGTIVLRDSLTITPSFYTDSNFLKIDHLHISTVVQKGSLFWWNYPFRTHGYWGLRKAGAWGPNVQFWKHP